MPNYRTTGTRFDRFSSKAEAHLICKLFKDFKLVRDPQVRKLKYQDKLIRDYECNTVPKSHVWVESDCTHGVFYKGKTSLIPELKRRLVPVLELYFKTITVPCNEVKLK